MNFRCSSRSAIFAGWTIAVGLIWAPRAAYAIPAFARAYDVACTACHTSVTRRNEFGDAFRKAGYRWPSELQSGEATAEREKTSVVMDGMGLMTGLLPKILPVSIASSFAVLYSNSAYPKVALDFPDFSLFAGGTLGKYLGFFAAWDVSDGFVPDEFVLHFTHLGGRPEFNIRVGLFEQTTTLYRTNDQLLDKTSYSLRGQEVSDYLINSDPVGGFVLSRGRLGTELNGVVLKRLFYAGGVVRSDIDDPHTAAYYHVSGKIGGMDFLGGDPDLDLSEPHFWESGSLTLAHYGYFGRVINPITPLTTVLNDVRRFGFEGKLQYLDAAIWSGLMLGDDVQADNATAATKSAIWFAEASYNVLSWLTVLYLYQQESSTGNTIYFRNDLAVFATVVENVRFTLRGGISNDPTADKSAEFRAFVAL